MSAAATVNPPTSTNPTENQTPSQASPAEQLVCQFLKACKQGTKEAFASFLTPEAKRNLAKAIAQVDISTHDLNDEAAPSVPALIAAVRGLNSIQVARALINQGADCNCKSPSGKTALWWACELGQEDIIDTLLEAGANVHIASHEHIDPPLLRILLNQELSIDRVLYLIDRFEQNGASLRDDRCQNTLPLHVASRRQSLPVVARFLLLNEGADFWAIDDFKQSPMSVACLKGSRNEKVAEFYERLQAKLDALSTREDQQRMVVAEAKRVLAEYKANKPEPSREELESLVARKWKMGPNVLAHTLKRFKGVDEVLAQKIGEAHRQKVGNEYISKRDAHGATLLHYMCHPAYYAPKTFAALYETKCDRHTQTEKGFTPLHIALRNGLNGHAKALIDEWGVANISTLGGERALHFAAERCSLEVVEKLLLARADLEWTSRDGRTALHHAAVKSSRKDVVAYLAERTEGINAQDKHGVTPLYEAISSRQPKEVIEILLKAGADPNICSLNTSPLLYADCQYHGHEQHEEIKALLISAGATEKGMIAETPPPLTGPTAPWLTIKAWERDVTSGAFQMDGLRRAENEYTMGANSADLYHADSGMKLRLKSLTIIATTPLYLPVSILVKVAQGIYGIGRAVFDQLSYLFCSIKSGEILNTIGAFVRIFIVIPIKALYHMFNIVITPFCALAMTFAGLQGIVAPNDGRRSMNKIAAWWGEERYLGFFGLEKVGNLYDSKVEHLKMYARKA